MPRVLTAIMGGGGSHSWPRTGGAGVGRGVSAGAHCAVSRLERGIGPVVLGTPLHGSSNFCSLSV